MAATTNQKSSWTTVDGVSVEVIEPKSRPEAGSPVAVIVDLHDLPSTHTDPVDWQTESLSQLRNEYNLLVVRPRSGDSWWLDRPFAGFFDRVTPEAFLIGPMLDWLKDHRGIVPPRIALFGIGMGGQGALRVAFRHPRRFPIVSAIRPIIDFHRHWGDRRPEYQSLNALFDSREAARQATALLHVLPLAPPRHIQFVCDPSEADVWESCDRLAMKLASLSIRFDAELGPHSPLAKAGTESGRVVRAVAWMIDALREERNRIV